MADLHIRKLFVGIDPGVTGGLGVVDQDGKYVYCCRWNPKDPRRIYLILEALAKGITGDIHCQGDNRQKFYKNLWYDASHAQGCPR